MGAMSTAGTKGVPRAERERQILDIATEEFGANTYQGMSLSAVASRAGVSKPLILSYFGSKEALFVACVERAGRNLCDQVEAALTYQGSTARRAHEVLRAFFEALGPRPHDWNIICDRTLPRGSRAAAATVAVHNRLADQAVRGVSASGGVARHPDPQDVAVLIEVWMSAVGAVVNWWLRHPEESAEQMVERCDRVIGLITTAGIPRSPDGTHK
jgi:AcrR family transcriptional regulator